MKIATGELEGVSEKSGITSFKGIPYGAPPVGDLRWKEPQPVKAWTGVRKADHFGPRAMQLPVFSDMVFRSDGMSEDCLYLNVWTPAKKSSQLYPVLVYFYGGGFIAGDGSEPRYDGENMATKGIVTLTVNYRLNIFGLFAHPELSKESGHNASGNYGIMDQAAALKWVRENIKVFGGDPSRVTIAGESAGSISVSALMASPLSKTLINGAIGESGSLLGALSPVVLSKAEENGIEFGKTIQATSLAALRALPADKLLEFLSKPGAPRFSMTVDGYVFPKAPLKIFEDGEQAKVPLLAGWNSEESGYRSITGAATPTIENFKTAVQKLYGENAEEILKVYKPGSDAEVETVARDLAGDRFISFSTWRWIELQAKTGGKPVYRYYYNKPRPQTADGKSPAAKGASHSAEIEYAMGNLSTNKVFAWTEDDYKVSKLLQEYFANFVKSANPNAAGLPQWSATKPGDVNVMQIDVISKEYKEKNRERYLLLEKIAATTR